MIPYVPPDLSDLVYDRISRSSLIRPVTWGFVPMWSSLAVFLPGQGLAEVVVPPPCILDLGTVDHTLR